MNPPVEDIRKRHKWISAHERSWAYSLAASLKKPRQISVWEVIMPLFLIFNYARAKANRDMLAQNFLFTKNLALKAALNMTQHGKSRATVLADVEEKTHKLLDSVEEGIYSQEIRTRQLKEIDVLIDHYCRLLQAEGKDYSALVTYAYGSRHHYGAFLDELTGLEQKVNHAALETVGSRADPTFVAAIEENTARLRGASVTNIFGENG